MVKQRRAIDPSNTALLRRQFESEMRKRFKSLIKTIVDLFLKDDILNEKRVPLTFNATFPKSQFQFSTDTQKVKLFQQWLKDQVDAGVLKVQGGVTGKPWTSTYVESAYRKGLMRAYTDTHKPDLRKPVPWYLGTKERFLKDAFLQPVTTKQLELLFTRAFDNLQGITATMSTQMGRILADGFVNGKGARTIAKEMKDSVVGLTMKRAMLIARTEVINAHATGQLDGFELLKIDKVFADVELALTTAGDALVCDKCESLEGKVFTIKQARGVIPIHPSCRCCWVGILSENDMKVKKRKSRAGSDIS